jgi:hypothetical protein
MFFRVKPAGNYQYLQIAHSVREGKKVRQQVKSHPLAGWICCSRAASWIGYCARGCASARA